MSHPVNSWAPNGEQTNGQQDGMLSSAFSKLNVQPAPGGMPPQMKQAIPPGMPPPQQQNSFGQPQPPSSAPGGVNHGMPPISQAPPGPGVGMNHNFPPTSQPSGPGAPPVMNHNIPTSTQSVGGGAPNANYNLQGAPQQQQHPGGPAGLNHNMPPTSQPMGMGGRQGMNHGLPNANQFAPPAPGGNQNSQLPHSQLGPGQNHNMPPVATSQPSMTPHMNQNQQPGPNMSAAPGGIMNTGMPSLPQVAPPQQPIGNMPQQQHQNQPSFRPPGPGMNSNMQPQQPPVNSHPGMVPPLGQPNLTGGPPAPNVNHGMPPHPGQQQNEIPSQQQGMYGRPPGPGQVPNHVQQPGMPPMPNVGAPMPNVGVPGGPGSSLPKRYPAYPQQPAMGGAMPNNPTYPSFPQQPQQQQPFQPGTQPQPQQDGGFYPGPGGMNTNAVPGGPMYPRPPGPGTQQGGMAQPNYPPQPQYGQPAGPGQYPQGQSAPQYAQPSAQQGQKRLDPDQMPSAIGVIQEDQATRGGIFRTDQKGLLPPLVTTKFQTEDFGNSSPRFMRSTMYSVPAQPDMLKQTAIPFALVVNPFESPAKDEQPIPCVDLGPMGPVRCIRCKAYMSPLMQFIDGGRRFQCLLCKATTEVPPEYFQHLDHTGQRVDKWERPELWKGTYEYIATPEYCRNNTMPKEPGFIFVIDVSYNNIKSGLVNLICSQMRNLMEALPSHTPVGFVTYNSKVHFYNIDPSLGKPQMVIVPDVADMFMPLLRGFLVPRAEAMDAIDLLMEQIPALFGDTKETEAVLGPAIVAGMEALKASDRVGKLLVFHSSLPTSELAPGKLKNREADRKLLGTDKEKTVLVPQSTYYNTLGQDCVGAGVSVDLYLFNNSYVDVATVGQVARLSGGSVSKYTYFQSEIDGPRVIGDVLFHLSRPIGFDAVMRVRTSTGVRPTDFFGHFYMANTTDVELAAIDAHKSIAVEIKHDASITDEDGVYIQIALLYTSIYGQRRLRVHNLALNTCMQMADLYRNCELDTIINFMAKQSISRSVDTTPQDLKETVIKRCALMLATYRKHCANPSMPGQLILPECLKLLPLFINCVLRSDAVAGTSEITPDDRSWLMYSVMTMGVASTVHYFYPQLVPVAGPKGGIDDPQPVRCSRDKLSEDSAFVLENGIYIFMWIGASVSPDWLQSIFGVSNLGQLNVEALTELPDHVNSDESLRLRAFIRSLRTERQRHMRLTMVRQRDKMELVMNRFLVEDRGTDGQPSYVDFLCHMHKEIRSLLNQ